MQWVGAGVDLRALFQSPDEPMVSFTRHSEQARVGVRSVRGSEEPRRQRISRQSRPGRLSAPRYRIQFIAEEQHVRSEGWIPLHAPDQRARKKEKSSNAKNSSDQHARLMNAAMSCGEKSDRTNRSRIVQHSALRFPEERATILAVGTVSRSRLATSSASP
jgi:hypothetical protein